jgi:hypothetical protein
MRKSIIIIAALLLLACGPVKAQSFSEGFFLDGYTMGYRYNPALSNEGDVLGLFQGNLVLRTNTGLSSFLYPQEDGQLVSALHESISSATFMSNLNDHNYLNRNVDLNIFSYGFRRGSGYHNVELNLRANISASAPKGIFQILKEGSTHTDNDLSGAFMGGQGYAELVYGYSTKLADWISIGGRAKLLLGLESVNYKLTDFELTMSEEEYKATLVADLELCNKVFKLRADDDGYYKILRLDPTGKHGILPAGIGLAVDLGVVLTPFEGFTLSVSALDLGGILWHYGNAGHSNGIVRFSGVTDLSIDDIKAKNLAGEFDGLKDDFLASLRLKESSKMNRMQSVPFTVNVAAKYDMPFYKPLSVGLTGLYCHFGTMPYKELRGNVAWNYSRKLGVTANLGAGEYGLVYGAALTVGVSRFHLNAGLENGFGGTLPYSKRQLKPNSKCLTVGLTYDL